VAYSDFSIKQVQEAFGLEIDEGLGGFAGIESVPVSDYFVATLEENIPLAVSINTEKARSELLIANVLIEVRKRLDRRISFFSGIEFPVDKDKGLTGYCDFIVSTAQEQLFLKAPVIAVVEAKNENLMAGMGQCIAEMVAATLFNEREGNGIRAVYGAVTTGVAWRFLKLADQRVRIDLRDYGLEDNPGRIIGILAAMVEQRA
jgi:hypothetical protein